MSLELKEISILEEHLPYELDMLDKAYELLITEMHNEEPNRVIVSLCIECFWLHARNLIEFFRGTNKSGRTAAAITFTKDQVAYVFDTNITEFINDQICHINYNRNILSESKLMGSEVKRNKESIDRAVLKFQDNLTEESRGHWSIRNPAKFIPSGSFYPSATNAIESATYTSSLFRLKEGLNAE